MSPATSRQQRTSNLNQIQPTQHTAGFMIDENGREIAITEQMIQQACAEFDRHWRPAARQSQGSR